MFYTKIPRYMKDDNFRLRPLRIFDGPFISNGLRDEVILKANGLNKPINSSWFFIWWWIRKTFMLAYCIECDSKRIGFIGLYNLRLGKSAEMTLVIFDKNNRRLGYGSRAFNILARNIKRNFLVETIIVKVKTDNHISASFWQKLGFKELNSTDEIKIMRMDLSNGE